MTIVAKQIPLDNTGVRTREVELPAYKNGYSIIRPNIITPYDDYVPSNGGLIRQPKVIDIEPVTNGVTTTGNVVNEIGLSTWDSILSTLHTWHVKTHGLIWLIVVLPACYYIYKRFIK